MAAEQGAVAVQAYFGLPIYPGWPPTALTSKSEQLTDTPAGSMHYHPAASPDGKWLVYGSKRDGVRQLYVMRLSDKKEHRITDLKKGHAAMWACWQPRAAP